MAKQRKTRKQKQIADKKRQISLPIQTNQAHNTPNLGIYKYTATTQNVPSEIKQQRIIPISSNDHSTISIIYHYTITDLRKTFFITTAIVLALLMVYIIEVHIKIL